MQFDFHKRELTLKIVYYGPALSGKTTNLQAIHHLVLPSSRGRLMTLDTKDDRTLFFDFLPLQFQTGSGLSIRIKTYTVPGQVMHNSTRRLVLQGADGVAFIADSQLSETKANLESFVNLKKNLRDNGLDINQIALVIQFNKRDLPNIRPDEEIDRLAQRGREPIFKAIAIQGKGVMETFLGILKLTWAKLQQKHDLKSKFQITQQNFMSFVHQHIAGKDRTFQRLQGELIK
jgi:hypothetical protein